MSGGPRGLGPFLTSPQLGPPATRRLTAAGPAASGGAPGRGFNGREGLEPGGGGGAGGGGEEEEEARAWPLFAAGVERQPDFGTFERLYASDTQSWRIEKFGRVCVVADAFLGLAPASSHGTALTVLAEVRPSRPSLPPSARRAG